MLSNNHRTRFELILNNKKSIWYRSEILPEILGKIENRNVRLMTDETILMSKN